MNLFSHSLKTLFLISALFVQGCGQLNPCFFLDTVRIKTDSNANDNSATAVDIVAVHDKTLLAELLNMTADQYFEKSTQIQNDYPDHVQIFHWEVVPSQLISSTNLSYKKNCPLDAIVFARYVTEGAHRIRIGQQRHMEINLKKDNFCLKPMTGPNEIFEPAQSKENGS